VLAVHVSVGLGGVTDDVTPEELWETLQADAGAWLEDNAARDGAAPWVSGHPRAVAAAAAAVVAGMAALASSWGSW